MTSELSSLVKSKDQLPPEMREKFEAWQQRQSKAHPLYSTSATAYGVVPRGTECVLENPAYPKGGKCGPGGSFTKSFVVMPSKEVRRTTLDTSMAKHRYLKELDPM